MCASRKPRDGGGSGTPGDSPGTHGELVPRACREVSESRGRAHPGHPLGAVSARGRADPGHPVRVRGAGIDPKAKRGSAVVNPACCKQSQPNTPFSKTLKRAYAVPRTGPSRVLVRVLDVLLDSRATRGRADGIDHRESCPRSGDEWVPRGMGGCE